MEKHVLVARLTPLDEKNDRMEVFGSDYDQSAMDEVRQSPESKNITMVTARGYNLLAKTIHLKGEEVFRELLGDIESASDGYKLVARTEVLNPVLGKWELYYKYEKDG